MVSIHLVAIDSCNGRATVFHCRLVLPFSNESPTYRKDMKGMVGWNLTRIPEDISFV